jgi:hypothetical protein
VPGACVGIVGVTAGGFIRFDTSLKVPQPASKSKPINSIGPREPKGNPFNLLLALDNFTTFNYLIIAFAI